ncbi:MAG: tRNA (N(6)-L-threonylcarbamoyladenosine(37)-C(2))-methylthiotransferase, partial [Candidatus Aenigmatarchaeota archaeon]
MPVAYIETYGCSANQSDSEIMAGLLSRAGFAILTDENAAAQADLVIINTCTVKAPTEHRTLCRIAELRKLGKPLIVAGCLAQSQPERVRALAPRASIVGTHAVTEIAKIAIRALDGKRVEALGEGGAKVCLPKIRRNPAIDIVQISKGCAGHCSFCAAKLARGNLLSYPVDDVIKEISAAHAAGCREFWLTSQDCGAYGLDIGTNLAELLKEITNKVKGKYFLRVGMANPTFAKMHINELIEAYQDSRVFKFLHIPAQSGSDRVLRDMKRGHFSSDVIDVVAAFREAFPKIQIWTDVIVGYPTETEEDFQLSLDLIDEIRPDYVNVSRFGPRPGTPAARLKPLPTETLKGRSRRMSELCRS